MIHRQATIIKYENIAKTMATIQIGITVLLRYPKPNSLNPPFSVYAKLGFKK